MMTHEEFSKRVNALAVELGASVEIEKRGEVITHVCVNVGRYAAFFITYNSYFDKIEVCTADGDESEIVPEYIEEYFALNYVNALSSHMVHVAEMAKEIITKTLEM